MLAADPLARELVADDRRSRAGRCRRRRPCSDAAGDDDPSGRPSAETTEPAAKTPSEITSMRRLPNMSPRRPNERREHGGREQVAGERPGDAAGVGVQRVASSASAGISVVCASANASAATPRISSVRVVWVVSRPGALDIAPARYVGRRDRAAPGYLTARISIVRMSGSEASRSDATWPSAFGISPFRCAWRASSVSNVSKMP